MKPKEVAEWLIGYEDRENQNPPFEAMHDDEIAAMFLPLARGYLAAMERLGECEGLFKRVRSFIENGTTYGYIDPLKPGSPEHKTAADVVWMICQFQHDRTDATLHTEQARVEGGDS